MTETNQTDEQKVRERRGRLTYRAIGLHDAARLCELMAPKYGRQTVKAFAEDLANEIRRLANNNLDKRDCGGIRGKSV
jgi:hypothetical protein